MLSQQKQKIGDFECVVVKDDECESPDAVVVLCHGFGAPATDLVSIAGEFFDREDGNRNVAYVFPFGPIELDALFDTRAWWMIDVERIQRLMMNGETRELKSHAPELLVERRKGLSNLIDLCRVDFKVDPSQVVVGGFSQGAMLATEVALNYTEVLGGLIVWSGSLINEVEWVEKSKSQSSLNVVQSHGRLDPVLPFSGAEDLCELLRSDGHSVKFQEFGGNHTIPMEAIGLAAELINRVAGQ